MAQPRACAFLHESDRAVNLLLGTFGPACTLESKLRESLSATEWAVARGRPPPATVMHRGWLGLRAQRAPSIMTSHRLARRFSTTCCRVLNKTHRDSWANGREKQASSLGSWAGVKFWRVFGGPALPNGACVAVLCYSKNDLGGALARGSGGWRLRLEEHH